MDIDAEAPRLIFAPKRAFGRADDKWIYYPSRSQRRCQFELTPGRSGEVQRVRQHDCLDPHWSRRSEQSARLNLEQLTGSRETRVEERLLAASISAPKARDFVGTTADASRRAFMVDELGLGGINAAIAVIDEPVAVIDVIEGNGEACLVETTHLEEQGAWRQHAR